MSNYTELAKHLAARSGEICRENCCTEDNHVCEALAYILGDGTLLDVCMSDYFQGTSKPRAAIPLPWTGTGEELQREVEKQSSDWTPDPGLPGGISPLSIWLNER